jgi:hypothetical protein
MPALGSTDVPVKAGSPEWGRSGAESLDRAEASPRIATVMARRSTALVCCGCRRPLRRCSGNVLRGESDAKSFGEAGELVRLPAIAQRDRDGDRLRIAVDR